MIKALISAILKQLSIKHQRGIKYYSICNLIIPTVLSPDTGTKGTGASTVRHQTKSTIILLDCNLVLILGWLDGTDSDTESSDTDTCCIGLTLVLKVLALVLVAVLVDT